MRWREQAHVTVLEQRNKHHAGDEATDVRTPGDASLAAFGERRAD